MYSICCRYDDSNVGSVDFIQAEKFGTPDQRKIPMVGEAGEF